MHVSQFADDLAIFTVSGDSGCSITTLEHSISTLDQNLGGLGLRIPPFSPLAVNPPKHKSTAFTQRSKIPRVPGVGCAFYCPEDDHHHSRTLSLLALIFFAEGYAINHALVYITHLVDDRKYIIMSYSLSALMGLQSPNINVKTNRVILDIKERFTALSHSSVSLVWTSPLPSKL
ncbi:hypothetical protein TKK_0019557 [Trichogramma kaykai]